MNVEGISEFEGHPNPSVIVTRHQGLVEYLRQNNVADEHTPVIAHATPDDVAGKRVWGVLPLRLAVHAKSVTEIPLALPEELRGEELSCEDVAKYAGHPQTYMVTDMTSAKQIVADIMAEDPGESDDDFLQGVSAGLAAAAKIVAAYMRPR